MRSVPPEPVPALVTLHLWGVPALRVPAALARMALDRKAVRALPGARFAKLLGTGDGASFTVRDADPRHWALLVAWAQESAAAGFEDSGPARSWGGIAEERAVLRLRPLASRGAWSGRAPFGDPAPARWDGPVAAITRARLRPRLARRFWRSVPPVSADLRRTPGLRLALGVGESPIGLQGTLSLWHSASALTDFAHRRSPHVEAVRRTAELGWYAEELFARFGLLDASGSYQGRPVDP